MQWFIKALSTSIGKKLLVGLTGLFLCIFLVVHLYINLHLLKTDGGEEFKALAHFMGNTWAIKVMEIGLFLGILLHIIYSILITLQNRSAKAVGYAKSPNPGTSSWVSRTMIFWGLLILVFLVIHLQGIYFKYKFGSEPVDLYVLTVQVMSDPVWAIVYILSMVGLGIHLYHGFQSAFQTFGWNTPKYKPLINLVAVVFWLGIPAGFAFLPVFFAFLGGHQ
ncbi:MAG: succinate dehydrogenase cytochrome b subunit [Bacteroidetes bacterium]|nr:succinate dehydrogenase cytochrome b subunit [Bacteroidota bacterium]